MSQPLPRYTQHPIHHDPLDALLARRAQELEQARTRIAAGHTPDADPTDLRGIPVIARGTTGTSPGTDPYQQAARHQ